MMTTLPIKPVVVPERLPEKVARLRLNRWDSPWLNPKLITGFSMVMFVVLLGVVGPLFWDVTQARVASTPLNIPPIWVKDHSAFFPDPDPAHPLGSESNGRDILALLMVAAPGSLRVGLIAAGLGMGIGIVLGFSAGLIGGWWDALVRTIADAVITIPSLAVLIVISSFVRQIDLNNMALLLALFAWPGPTRLLRAQVLSLRERGYVQMARLSGASTFDIMFKEMLPNLLPYLAASFSGNVSANILAAAGLEVLGLGPTRVPTLGMTIFYSIRAASILRGMWWWWGFPILLLMVIFTGLFLISVGLDEIANPRLRGVQAG
jgi:peptide/nickel transport system permease protein